MRWIWSDSGDRAVRVRALAGALRFEQVGTALARETKGSGDKGFPVQESRTSGPHVCSRDVSATCKGES